MENRTHRHPMKTRLFSSSCSRKPRFHHPFFSHVSQRRPQLLLTLSPCKRTNIDVIILLSINWINTHHRFKLRACSSILLHTAPLLLPNFILNSTPYCNRNGKKKLMPRHMMNSMALKFSSILFFFLNFFFCIRPSCPAVLAPIVQGPSTRQYMLSLYLKTPLQPTNLLLDLGASLSWVDCTTNGTSFYHPIPCNSPLCSSLASSPAVCSHCSEPATPACANDPCHAFLSTPRHRKGVTVQAVVDKLALPITDGSNPGQLRVTPEFVLSCSKRSLLKGLVPRGMTGLAALGRSNFSLATQVTTGSPKVFALCLSGSPSAPGVAFFGTAGPYNFLPQTDLSKYLNYTPLLSSQGNNNRPSSEYFIGLTSIAVNGRIAVQLNRTRMALAGAKLSSEAPFTILESSIYAALTKAFVNESAALDLTLTQPQPAATPFSVCFDEVEVADTTTGPAVPTIDLILQGADQKFWRIFGSNSMVRISRSSEGVDVWCLAFVDGGINTRWPIVIGGHQMVDNLLQFDLESERLGYSSSVLVHNTMCANFNFTVNTSLT